MKLVSIILFLLVSSSFFAGIFYTHLEFILFIFLLFFLLRSGLEKKLKRREDSDVRSLEENENENNIGGNISEISARNIKHKKEKEKRKMNLQIYSQKFSNSITLLKKNKIELKEKIKISVLKRLEERSNFLKCRMKISDECQQLISKLMESYLLSQKHGFEITDITFRRKNLTDEVDLFYFYFMFILILYLFRFYFYSNFIFVLSLLLFYFYSILFLFLFLQFWILFFFFSTLSCFSCIYLYIHLFFFLSLFILGHYAYNGRCEIRRIVQQKRI